MLEFDGSTMEGGGQILRTAVALSLVLKTPCRVFNIRKARKNPGLSHQHLLGIQAAAEFSGGTLMGDYLGSDEITFSPGSDYKENVNINITTAGSITLCMQILIVPAICSARPVTFTFKGGATDTFFSPTLDYFQYVFLKNLEKIGVKAEIKVIKRGYYPEGGAELILKTEPSRLKPVSLTERGNLKNILVLSGASEFLKKKKVSERQAAGVREVIGKLKLPVQEKIDYYQTKCPGSQICMVAEFENATFGSDNLGKLGKKAEDVGKETAINLLKEEKSKTCLDKNMADQILPYISLLSEKSKLSASEITNHCKTNMWVIEKFGMGKFETKENLINWIPKG